MEKERFTMQRGAKYAPDVSKYDSTGVAFFYITSEFGPRPFLP